MPRFRTIADLRALSGADSLTPAEADLVDRCIAGKDCSRGDGQRPPELPVGADPDPDRTIRAEVLRCLILGGKDGKETDERGVWLFGAHVTGRLHLDFATARGGTRLENCRFDEKITAVQARFEGLDLTGSALPGLFAQGAKVAGSVFLRGLEASGTIYLNSAEIGGQIACAGSRFTAPEVALDAQRAKVAGSVVLRGLEASGTIYLNSADIGGQIACAGSRFTATPVALNAQGAKVAGDFFFRDLEASGTLDLAGAEIGGQIACAGSRFTATPRALNAQSAKITGSVFLTDLEASGTLDLAGAEIGGAIDCSGSHFTATSVALNAQRAKVTGGVFLRNLEASGTIYLNSAEIGGQIECARSRFTATEVALDAHHVRAQALVWRNVTQTDGTVNLTGAHVGSLVDNTASWPPAGRLILQGFTYDRLSGDTTPTDAPTRLGWLARGDTFNGTFTPQPYSQLAKVLREMGHEADARAVLMERERRMAAEQYRRDLQTLHDLRHSLAKPSDRPSIDLHLLTMDIRRLRSGFLRRLIGYGYAPFRSVAWLIILIAFTWVFAIGAWVDGDFVPASPGAALSQDWAKLANDPKVANPAADWTAPGAPGASYEHFSAPAWAASLVVPVLSFGQIAAWQPAEDRGWIGWAFWWLRWPLEALGWLSARWGWRRSAA